MAHAWLQGLQESIGELLEGAGFELVLAEFFDDSRILRLYIDRLDDEGVTIDDCTTVSRLVSDSLDAEGFSDQIRGRYNLEVSSPGLDRPLAKPEHFQRFVGEVVKATSHMAVSGRKRFQGELVSATEAGCSIEVDGEVYDLAFDNIAKARLVPQF